MSDQDEPKKVKPNRSKKISLTDLIISEEATAVTIPHAPATPKPGSKASEWQSIWQALNDRQKAYLTAIYQTDQEKEIAEQKKGWQPGDRKTPASVWRWLLYHTYAKDDHSPLKRRIREAKILEEGTQFTFNSLVKCNLIERKAPDRKSQFWEERDTTFYVKITPLGRKVVRQATSSTAPKRAPVGTLTANQWQAVVTLYQAAHAAGIRYPKEYASGISQRTIDRLENHVDGVLAVTYSRLKNLNRQAGQDSYENKMQRWLRLTREGVHYYHRSHAYYAKLYPDITPAAPPTHEEFLALEDLYDQVDFMVEPTGYIESYVNLRLLSHLVNRRVVTLGSNFSSNGVRDALAASMLAAVEKAKQAGKEVNPQDEVTVKLNRHNMLQFGTSIRWQSPSQLRDLCTWVGTTPKALILQSKFVQSLATSNKPLVSSSLSARQPGEVGTENRELYELVMAQIRQDTGLNALSREVLEQLYHELFLGSLAEEADTKKVKDS